MVAQCTLGTSHLLIWPDCYGFVCTFLASFPDHRRNILSYSLEIRLVHVCSASRQYFSPIIVLSSKSKQKSRCGCTSNHPCVSFHSIIFHPQWNFGSNKFMHGYGSFSVPDSPKLQYEIQDGKPGYSPTVMSLLSVTHTRWFLALEAGQEVCSTVFVSGTC